MEKWKKEQLYKSLEFIVDNIIELTDFVPGQKNKSQLCSILRIPPEQCKFSLFKDLSTDIERDYIIGKIIDDESIKSHELFIDSENEYAFDGKILKSSYTDETELRIGDQSITTMLKSVFVEIDGIKFIIMPNWYEDANADFKGRYWIVCHKNHFERVVKIKNDLVKAHSFFKNSLVEVKSSLEIIDSAILFDINDIVISDETVNVVESILSLVKHYNQMKLNNLHIHKGIIIKGVPGTGKSTTCNAIIKKALSYGATCFKVYNLNNGMGRAISLTDVFEIAQHFGPSIVILEDADVIKRDAVSSYRVTNDFLKTLEDSKKYPDVICICTTNETEDLDQAIRPGRIDRIVNFSYPSEKEIDKLFDLHVNKYNLNIEDNIRGQIKSDLCKRELTGAVVNSICLEIKRHMIINQIDMFDDYPFYKDLISCIILPKSTKSCVL
jgi:SpoVK/Ycf46/Vps4 family AAA+-type ATPase